ncbi:hypothetical protein [Vibrio lentus]|uniref:hypothetical protein n=1 Tax=Vibrio lentus TaxID=136468 RepID=UPI0009755E2C|nr:hypothetical protein [Vibrio lentus]OMO20490.1 hypothetical protein BH583_14105 [Vibrio lentus]PMN11247.1 hypothetical protein BCT38_05525 [Vibrio lentus]
MKKLIFVLSTLTICLSLIACSGSSATTEKSESMEMTTSSVTENDSMPKDIDMSKVSEGEEVFQKGLGGTCKTHKGNKCYIPGQCLQGGLCSCKVGNGIEMGSSQC